MPDTLFTDPSLAELYDLLDGPRDDLDLYLAVRRELGAGSVLDIGCGTGSFACALALEGVEVTALDPAAAMVEVARAKPGSDLVRFIVGDVEDLPPLDVDLVTMTGNVAQVFLADEAWTRVLTASRDALQPNGHLVFETRVPEVEAWRSWTKEASYDVFELPAGGRIETWHELVEVRPPFVTFSSVVVKDTGELLTSRSTLRFRSIEEIRTSLSAAGFHLGDVRDAPDRPGLEHVVVARPIAT